MFWAITAALASAASFALGSALQHRAAGRTAKHEDSSHRLVIALAQRKSWLLGLGLCAVAFALQAVALSQGDIAVVQPVLVSGIVFAVILRAVLDRRRPSRREVAWCGTTWAGLALFIAVMPEVASERPEPQHAVWLLGAGLVAAVMSVAISRRVGIPTRQGLLLATASGILFGLVAGLMKLALAQTEGGPVQLLTHWSPYAVVVVGAAAVLLNQRAYQVTRLSVSSPVLNIVQLGMALTFGIVVFSERLAESPLVLALQVVALLVIASGVRQLAVLDDQAQQPVPEPARS